MKNKEQATKDKKNKIQMKIYINKMVFKKPQHKIILKRSKS